MIKLKLVTSIKKVLLKNKNKNTNHQSATVTTLQCIKRGRISDTIVQYNTTYSSTTNLRSKNNNKNNTTKITKLFCLHTPPVVGVPYQRTSSDM